MIANDQMITEGDLANPDLLVFSLHVILTEVWYLITNSTSGINGHIIKNTSGAVSFEWSLVARKQGAYFFPTINLCKVRSMNYSIHFYFILRIFAQEPSIVAGKSNKGQVPVLEWYLKTRYTRIAQSICPSPENNYKSWLSTSQGAIGFNASYCFP